MKTNIALIGMMGTGKTAVGQVLARKLAKDFVELDLLIEKKAGKSIPDIFKNDGEIAFRELEIEVTREVAAKKDVIIACGGGVVLNKINIDRLRVTGITVYLTASPSVIINRVASQEGQRPLLNVEDPAQKLKELLKFRKPFYERAADIMVNTSRRDINGVAGEIIRRLREDASFNL